MLFQRSRPALAILHAGQLTVPSQLDRAPPMHRHGLELLGARDFPTAGPINNARRLFRSEGESCKCVVKQKFFSIRTTRQI